MKTFSAVVFLGLLGAAVYAGINYGALDFIEQQAPQIEFANLPQGVGLQGAQFEVKIADTGAGLERVRVSLVQLGKSQLLVEKNYPRGQREDQLALTIPGKSENQLKEGNAEIVVDVFDSSLWSTSAQKQTQLPVDYRVPKVELLTKQHAVAQGGAELVFFRVKDENFASAEVHVGDHKFIAVPAAKFSPDFANQTDIYGGLFALPVDYDPGTKCQVVARDLVGNQGQAEFSFRLLKKKRRAVDSILARHFLERKVLPLYREYEEIAKEKLADEDFNTGPGAAEVFRAVNESYRAVLIEKLAQLSANSAPEPKWSGVFSKPMPSAISSSFGEERSYFFEQNPAGGSRHDGLDLASISNDSVKASNDGVVVLSNSLGIYGNAVVIDHGLGLLSLYGHLSSTAVEVGEQVRGGQEIGRTGETGLAGGDHLHFEFRLGNLPVDPREWWDSHWIKDNIDWKIQATRERIPEAG